MNRWRHAWRFGRAVTKSSGVPPSGWLPRRPLLCAQRSLWSFLFDIRNAATFAFGSFSFSPISLAVVQPVHSALDPSASSVVIAAHDFSDACHRFEICYSLHSNDSIYFPALRFATPCIPFASQLLLSLQQPCLF